MPPNLNQQPSQSLPSQKPQTVEKHLTTDMLGDAAEVQRSATCTKILAALGEDLEPRTPKEIAEATDLTSNVVKQRLRGMVKSGEVVKVVRGRYAHRDYTPPVTVVTA